MIKAFEMTPDRRLKLHYSGEDGDSVATLDEIPVEAILALPTPIGADITRCMHRFGWGLRQGKEGTVWYRGEDQPEPDPIIGTTTRSAVALRILCALLPAGNYRMATVIDDAFEMADRFLARMERR